MRLRMIRLAGAPEGAEAGEGRLVVCSGLLRLGMDNSCCWYRVPDRPVPERPTPLPGTALGPAPRSHVAKPAHKSEPGSRIQHQETQSSELLPLLSAAAAPQTPGAPAERAAAPTSASSSQREQPLLFASLAANHCGSK